MKLLNYTGAYFAGILLIIISTWATLFYYDMLDEIYDSIDDGLDNQKGLIIQKAAYDSSVLAKQNFGESDYAIQEIPAGEAMHYQDTYVDTMMYMQNEKSDEPVRLLKTVFLQNGRYYRLQVGTSMVEEDDLIKQLFYSILWLYMGLVVTIIVFNNFLLKKIWRPFYHLMSQLRRFRIDKPQPIAPVPTRVDEFRLLNETVEKLLKRNTDIFSGQKNFIENASHELQTPLAISINKLETLADSQQLTAGQMQLLAGALDNLERLTRLNRSLLLLFKIENRQFPGEALVNLNRLVKKVVEDFSDQVSFNDLAMTVVENGNCTPRMNGDLASILVTNLVKNAIIHNHPKGAVTIRVDQYALRVENTGQPGPLDSEKIFHRFHSGQPSRTSSGLGLAIVRAIADLYKFRVEYRYEAKHIMIVDFM